MRISIALFFAAWSAAPTTVRAECTVEQTTELASSASLSELMTLCGELHRLGPGPVIGVEPSPLPSGVTGSEIDQLRNACIANSEKLPCVAADWPEGSRRIVAEQWLRTLRDAERRFVKATELCGALDASPIDANDQSRLELRSAVFAFCACRAQPSCEIPGWAAIYRATAASELLRTAPQGMRVDAGAVTRRAAEIENEMQLAEQDQVVGAAPALAGAADATETASILDTVIQGLALFLVQRARAEVDAFVIERVRRELCSDGIQSALLDNTCRFLSNGDFLFSASFGTSFQAAVLADIVELPRNALEHVQGLQAIDTKDGVLARMTLELVVALLESAGAQDILARLSDAASSDALCRSGDDECTKLRDHIRQIIRLTGAIAGQIATLGDDEQPNLAAIDAIVRALVSNIDAERLGHARQIAVHLHQLTLTLRQMAEAATQIARVAVDAAGEAEETASAIAAFTSDPRARFVEPIARHVVAALNFALRAVGVDQRIPTSVPSLLGALASGQPEQAATRSLRLVSELLSEVNDTEVPEVVVRVVALGTDLATAADAEAAAEVIDEFAAPVGSWRRKEREVTVSLTGLVGIGGGAAFHLGTDRTESARGGFLAPVGMVGVDWAFPLAPDATDPGGSFGFFLSLIDLGAILDFSTSEPEPTERETGSTNPPVDEEIEPLAILAPGAHVRFGIPTTPLVIAAGGSYQPRGATFEYEDAMGATREASVPVVRLHVMLTADVTIVAF